MLWIIEYRRLNKEYNKVEQELDSLYARYLIRYRVLITLLENNEPMPNVLRAKKAYRLVWDQLQEKFNKLRILQDSLLDLLELERAVDVSGM